MRGETVIKVENSLAKLWVPSVILVPAEINARFDRVLSFDPRQVIDEVVSVPPFVSSSPKRADRVNKTGNTEPRCGIRGVPTADSWYLKIVVGLVDACRRSKVRPPPSITTPEMVDQIWPDEEVIIEPDSTTHFIIDVAVVQ